MNSNMIMIMIIITVEAFFSLSSNRGLRH